MIKLHKELIFTDLDIAIHATFSDQVKPHTAQCVIIV